MVSASEIHRNRFPVSKLFIRDEIWAFIQTYCRPSTDYSKVKVIGSEIFQTHYRSTTIDNLYLNFLKQSTLEFHISQSAFYTFLPNWLVMRKKYEGICKICFLAYFYAKQLRTFRIYKHKDCTCSCLMCNQCNHGKGTIITVCLLINIRFEIRLLFNNL